MICRGLDRYCDEWLEVGVSVPPRAGLAVMFGANLAHSVESFIGRAKAKRWLQGWLNGDASVMHNPCKSRGNMDHFSALIGLGL